MIFPFSFECSAYQHFLVWYKILKKQSAVLAFQPNVNKRPETGYCAEFCRNPETWSLHYSVSGK